MSFIFFSKQPITSSPPKWMAELENDDIDMLKGEYEYCEQKLRLPKQMGIQYLLKKLKTVVL